MLVIKDYQSRWPEEEGQTPRHFFPPSLAMLGQCLVDLSPEFVVLTQVEKVNRKNRLLFWNIVAFVYLSNCIPYLVYNRKRSTMLS
jgi:hypothetical protein